jgi:hypothetical protein
MPTTASKGPASSSTTESLMRRVETFRGSALSSKTTDDRSTAGSRITRSSLALAAKAGVAIAIAAATTAEDQRRGNRIIARPAG